MAAFRLPTGRDVGTIQQASALLNYFFPNGGDFQLRIWPDKAIDAVYTEGEWLTLNIVAETDAYLYVDYYQPNGQVSHFPANHQDHQFIDAGKIVSLPGPEGKASFPITAQLGEGLLAVIASQKPLARGTGDHGIVEPAAPYISRFAGSLEDYKGTVKLAGASLVILTKKEEQSIAPEQTLGVPLLQDLSSGILPPVAQSPEISNESPAVNKAVPAPKKSVRKKHPTRQAPSPKGRSENSSEWYIRK